MAARLVEDGHRLRCLVRRLDEPGADYLKNLGAELVEGDILNADSIAAAAEGADTFIHLVGIIFEPRGVTFEQVHVKGTMNAIGAAAVTGARRYLHMSALGAGPDGKTEYFRTKWAAEEAVRESDLAYTIFRPSIIYGPGGEFIDMLLKQVRLLPVVPVLGSGRSRLQPISVYDVAACYAGAINNERTVNKAYELCGPEVLDYNRLIDLICEALDKRRLKMHIPMVLVRPAARLSERLQSKPMLTTDQLNMLLAESLCDNAAVRDDLAIDPMSFSEGLRLLI